MARIKAARPLPVAKTISKKKSSKILKERRKKLVFFCKNNGNECIIDVLFSGKCISTFFINKEQLITHINQKQITSSTTVEKIEEMLQSISIDEFSRLIEDFDKIILF